VIESTLQHKLEEMSRQLSAIQSSSREDPAQRRTTLRRELETLQRSLDEARAALGALPGNEAPTGLDAAPANGHSPDALGIVSKLNFRERSERGPVLVRISGPDAACRWVNAAWTDFAGRDMDALLGKGWTQDVHPADRERCAGVFREAWASSRLYAVEYRLARKNGEYGWLLEIGAPRLADDGTVEGYVGTAIEITEHKLAEARLAMQYAVTRVLSEAEVLEGAAGPILQTMCDKLGWDVGELWSVEERESVPRCAQVWATSSVDASALQVDARSRNLPSSPGIAWQDGAMVWIADIGTNEVLGREPEAMRVGLHGMFQLPVSVHGSIRVILRLFSLQVRERDEDVVEFMTSVGVQIGQFLERQQHLDRIRDSEARKSAILEASLDAVITVDDQGQVIEFNSAAETIFGLRRADVLGRVLLGRVVPARFRDQAWALFRRLLAVSESGMLGRRFEAVAMRADGSEFPVEIALAPIGNGAPRLVTIYVSDATERKRSEHEVRLYQMRLRSLMADLLVTEEHERRILSVDLHDGLSQTIALTQIKLSALRGCVDAKQQKAVDVIRDLVEQANRTARSISFELSPPILHDLGLEPAVQWLAENIHERYGLQVVLEDDGQPKPADEMTRVILFRSIRELLINAAKHAQAQRVRVSLKREQDQLDAVVEDDGVGMTPDLGIVEGSGLLSIQERLRHVGGSMRIDSQPGRGTKIRLCAPIHGQGSRKSAVES
jgi:PAS domain S-box-containing protein